MLINISSLFQSTLYNISLIPPATNETSFQIMVNSTTQSGTPMIGTASAFASAFVGAIIGSVISGYYLIRKVREEKKLEIFSDVFDNIYAPFQNITINISGKSVLGDDVRVKLMRLINNNKWVILCPSDIKHDLRRLYISLKEDEDDEVILMSVAGINSKIDRIINEVSFRR